MPSKRCGVQISNRKSKFKIRMSIWILAILISLFASITYYYMESNKRSIYPYTYAKWGMSLEECEQVIDRLDTKNKIVLEEDQKIICTIADYEGRKDIDALMTFTCKEDGLEEIKVHLINRKGVSYTKDQLIKEYVEMLDRLCGKHDKRFNVYTWVANRSKLQVIDLPDKPVIVTYKWINKTLY